MILNYYSLIFDIKWFDDGNFEKHMNDDESPGSLWFYQTFLFRFILTTIVGSINLIAVLIAAKYIKEGTLGVDPKTGKKAEFPQV